MIYRQNSEKFAASRCNASSGNEQLYYWGVAKWLRHRVLIPAYLGSNPSTPANLFLRTKPEGASHV